MKRHSTSPPCGNLVDGLPHACHTETIAKPARLGSAKNRATWENSIELSMFWWMTLRKVHRKPCRAYIKDQYGCHKMLKRNVTTRPMISLNFRNSEKMRILRKNRKIWKFQISEREMKRMLWDDEALYESSVRKLGWRFTARLPYQNTIELGQSGAAHANSFDYENIVFDEKTIDNSSRESNNCFK